MSAAPRIPLAQAVEVAAYLARLWKLGDPKDCVVGSVRRGKPDVGDLEFIAPLPHDPRDPHDDPVFRTIAGTVDRPAEEQPKLFGAAPEPQAGRAIGQAVIGLKPGFKMCRIAVKGRSGVQLTVEINRYTPGEQGNRGWVQLVRTGPDDFGKAFLGHWKQLNGIPPAAGVGESDQEATGCRGSIDFYLVGKDQKPVPGASSNELQVFCAARLLWVPPELRSEAAIACVDWVGADRWRREKLAKALVLLGLNESEVEGTFREQSYARYAAGGVS